MGQWPLHVHAVACLAACALPSLSLPPTGHGHNTNKSSCWPAPRQNPKPELRSTKHSLRVDRSQTAWPPQPAARAALYFLCHGTVCS